MSKFSQKKQPKEQEKIKKSILQESMDIKSSDSFQQSSTKVQTLSLYDTPKKLQVELFYEIMETRELKLLMVNPKEELSEKQNQELSLRLIDVWFDLQEFYYSHTNKQSFDRFKDSLRRVIQLENEITTCIAALELVKLESADESIFEVLKKFGINTQDAGKIHKAILRKKTKLEFAKNKLDNKSSDTDKKEVASFYKLLAGVERQLNRQLNIQEINLERWVAYLEDIREKSEAEKKAASKTKSKRRK
jgi:hypothetical protein